jgi:hypothetical protein
MIIGDPPPHSRVAERALSVTYATAPVSSAAALHSLAFQGTHKYTENRSYYTVTKYEGVINVSIT